MVRELKQWMETNDWTQADLADAIGYAQPTVCGVLTGKREPSFRFKAEIELITGLPASGWKTTRRAGA
jgi:transcriptional regulator with XRE-family HTH domain